MAEKASAGNTFVEKLTRFRQLLHDTESDNDISARFYTETNIALICDLTSCMQVTENRVQLSPRDVSNVISAAEKFISSICESFDRDAAEFCSKDNSTVQLSLQTVIKENTVNDSCAAVIKKNVEILTVYLRLLRNACANSPCHQSVLQRNKSFISCLARGVNLYMLPANSTEALSALKIVGPVVWRCALQLACNAVICHADNAALFWGEFCPVIRSVLETTDADAGLQKYCCCLMYQCLLSNPHRYMRQLVHAVENSPPLMCTVLNYLVDNDCEWGLYLCEKLIAGESIDGRSTLYLLWSHLSACHKKYLLELTHCSLQRISANEQSDSYLPVSVDNMSCIADEFVASADLLPTLLVHSNESEKLERDISLQLLRCLCVATMHRYTYSRLHDNSALLRSTLSVLKSLHLIKCVSDIPANTASKAALNTVDVYNVKSDLMRLVANLVYHHTTNQHLLRDLDGIALVLDHTSVDANNPYIVQWAVLAVRNLCEGNEANQRYIADMQLHGPTSKTVDLLSEIGVKLSSV